MALRDGTYAGARDQFQEALRLFPDYVEALSGLTLASNELDDTEGATQAMMRVNRLVPDRTRLPVDDRLRIESALAFVDRSYDDAVAAYAALAARHPDDAGAWLDLAMACDAAGRRVDARTHLDHALKIDTQLAAAHLSAP